MKRERRKLDDIYNREEKRDMRLLDEEWIGGC
jgi:hypothetical protein